MTERELVIAARRGDQAAFASLYDRYHRAVFHALVARLRNREDAEDALQATFVAAWRSLPRLRRPGRFVPWLFRIARSRAEDLRRQRGPAHPASDHLEDLIGPTDGDPPDTERLRAVVAELRPDSRAILFLTAAHGWTSEEAARALGKSPATIRRRRARILEHLRDALGRRSDDE